MRAATDWQRHRAEVNRASFSDCDGMLWFGDHVWQDGRMFVDIFWTHYADHIDERNHGRALRALAAATLKGIKTFPTKAAFREVLVATMTPFWKKKGEVRSSTDCRYCGRPYEGVQQCKGCGAWRRES